MARQRQLGYEYLAVTDHAQWGGRLEAQWEAIEALNAELAPFRLLRVAWRSTSAWTAHSTSPTSSWRRATG